MRSLSEIKSRLQSLNQRTKKNNDIFKAKDEHMLRLLAYPHGNGDPFLVIVRHYDIGGQSVLCPKAMYGEQCDICDFCNKLTAWKDPATGEDKPEHIRKADFEIFKKIQPREGVLVACIERMKDGAWSADGPKFFAVNQTNLTKIMEFCSDAERLSAVGLDPATESDRGLEVFFGSGKAFELKVTFKGAAGQPNAKGNTKNRPVIEIDAGITPKPFSKNKEDLTKVLAGVKRIEEVYPKQSSEEVSKIFKSWINSMDKEAEPEGGVEYTPNTKESAKVTGTKSIDEAFGELADEG